MQSPQLQKDKLKLIEKIMETDDKVLIDYFNDVLSNGLSDYQLSEEQLQMIEESREKYISGEDKGKSWNELKNTLLKKRNEKL